MAERLVAADASPLIGLAAAGAFDLLRRLFGRIVVTAEVRDEVPAGGELPGASELASAIRDGWIEVRHIRTDGTDLLHLDAGESSTLAFAVSHEGPCLALMDESLGRSYARAHGLNVTGVAGVLLAAKNARLVHRVRPFFDRLEKSNFRLATAIIDAVLEQAEEANPRT